MRNFRYFLEVRDAIGWFYFPVKRGNPDAHVISTVEGGWGLFSQEGGMEVRGEGLRWRLRMGMRMRMRGFFWLSGWGEEPGGVFGYLGGEKSRGG